MKCKPISRLQQLLLSAPLVMATFALSPLTYAITPEEGRQTYIWQGFQGGADHKGYNPVSLIVDDTPDKVEGWPMQALVTHSINTGSSYSFFHANGADISTAVHLQFHQKLNQPTVTESAVILTNQGYVTPFTVSHIDRDTNVFSYFDYLDSETSYIVDGNGDFLDDIYCTQSQSQAVYKDDVAYIATNYYELSSEDRLCDPTIDVPDNQFTHLRAHPIRPDKRPSGGEGLELVNQAATRLAIPAHHKDQFLSPALAGSEVFSQGGGFTSTRDHTGVYSISNTGSSAEVNITNNWSNANDRGYVTVAPNSYWSPVVTSTKILTFLNGTEDADYRNNIPTLTEIDRATGEVVSTRIQQVTSIDFAPTQESSFNVFNMATAPVAADDNTIVVINNGNLIIFDINSPNYSAPQPINGDFYGQPVVAGDVIYALSRNQATCPGYQSCVRAFSVTAASPIKDSANDDWVWLPPSTTENLDFPFVGTDSHVFISSDSGSTYGVNASRAVPNANRLEMTYPLNGALAFSYDTLFIAHNADDVTATTYPDLRFARPFIPTSEVAALNTTLQTAWNSHNTDRAAFAAAVKSNNASVLAALTFPLDGTQVADLDVNLSIIAPSLNPATVEVEQALTYQVTITNNGALAATNVIAEAVIPGAVNLDETGYTGPVQCSLALSTMTCEVDGSPTSDSNSLLSGESATFTFNVIPKLRSQIEMTVEADGTELNPDDPTIDTDDNSVMRAVESVAASPSNHDLSLAITSNEYVVGRGKNITYMITATNLAELSTSPGTPSATALDVRIDFEVNDTTIEEVFSAGNCSLTNCEIARLDAGATQTFEIVTRTIGAGQGGLNARVESSRDELTDVAMTNNSANFGDTQVSNLQTAETAEELPKASGSLNLAMLLASLILMGSCYQRRQKQKKNKK